MVDANNRMEKEEVLRFDQAGEAESSLREASPSTSTMTQLSLVPVFEIPRNRPMPTNPYEMYASLFPNPNLNAEIMERENLLKAISAADHAVAVNPKPAKSSWFGWGSKKQEKNDIIKMDLEDDDRLVYSDALDETCAFPMAKIDSTAIPVEAHALARYQMVQNMRFTEAEQGTVDLTNGRLFDSHVSHCVTLQNGTCFAASASLVLVYNDESRSPVAQIPPSPAIYQKLAEQFFLEQEDDTALLRIVGLRLISDSILIIARLGGFLEFVDVGGGQEPTIALTTNDYHTDLLGIENFGETSIVAFGGVLEDNADLSFNDTDEKSSSNLGCQIITVWDYQGRSGIQLLQVISLDVPSSSVIFSYKSAVARYWRIPRTVRLRSPEDGLPTQQRSPTSVTFPTPITQIAIGTDKWAAVDGLGGVTIYKVDSVSGEVSLLQDRSTAALEIAPIASAAFADDLLFLLTNDGELYCWNDASRVQVSPFARCLLPSRPIRIVLEEPDTTKIALLQTSIGTDTISMLLQTGNVQQALSIGKHLATPDLESCRKDSWMQSKDISILSDVKDTSYVIEQAMSPVHMEFKVYRDVCRLAVERIRGARLGEIVSFAASIEERENIVIALERRILFCGTYELLCSHMQYDPSLSHFLDDFLGASMEDLALHFASVGDMASLSLFLFRHPSQDLLEILDDIPLATDPKQYVHFLPLPDDKKPTVFFISQDNAKNDIASLPSYIETCFGIPVVLDDSDLEVVNCLRRGQPQIDRKELAAWFVKRADLISNFLGSICYTKTFTEIAIATLKEANSIEHEIPERLLVLHQFTNMLDTMVTGESEPMIRSPLVTMNHQSLDEMSTNNLVKTVLTGSSTDYVNIQQRYKRLLLPLLELRHENLEDIDKEVVGACFETSGNADNVLDWMREKVELLKASRLSLDEDERVIKDPLLFFETVIAVAEQVFSFAKWATMSDENVTTFVDVFWQIYECLPEKSSALANQGDELVNGLSNRADQLYIDLITMEIGAGWVGSMSVLLSYFPIHFNESRDMKVHEAGHAIASLMCKSLSEKITSSAENDGIKAVISTLLGDLKEFNQRCFQSNLNLPNIVYKSLARPLLLAHHITALGYLLECGGPDILDIKQLSEEVLMLYNAAVNGEDSSEDEIQAAAQFRDVLGNWMPTIMDDFNATGKFLDVSRLISNLLNEQTRGVLLPNDIREMQPLDVIDLVMARNPSCFIQHAKEWTDEDWAAAANRTTRLHFEGHGDIPFPGNHERQQQLPPLPPLPGIPVFRLAELLGLDDSTSIVNVKARIIHYGAKAAHYGASAAVCRTLLADVIETGVNSIAALEATAAIVASREYQDIQTKRELCIKSLLLNIDTESHRAAVAAGRILRSYEDFELDWLSSRLYENGTLRQAADGIQSHYSTSLLSLLHSLRRQLCDLLFDDELFVILARYTFFWCIGRATKPLLYPYFSFYSIATDSGIRFACALSVHVEKTSKFDSLYKEISSTLSSEKDKVSPIGDTTWADVDESLVKRLVHRGYSECGARRAVAMTNSIGFDDALQWAVGHSLDEHFDDPILLVRNIDQTRIDEESLFLCQQYVSKLQDCRVKHTEGRNERREPELRTNSSLNARCISIESTDFVENAWSGDDDYEDLGEKTLDVSTPEQTQNDKSENATIMGGWDDHDELDLDTGLEEVFNDTGWNDDDVDLNTILEGEHETSELITTTPTVDTSIENKLSVIETDSPTNAILEEQEHKDAGELGSGWDDDVDFDDFSDSIEDKPSDSCDRNAHTEDKSKHETTSNMHEQNISMNIDHQENPNRELLANSSNVQKLHDFPSAQETPGTIPMMKTSELSKQGSGQVLREDLPSVAFSTNQTEHCSNVYAAPPRSAPLPRSKLLEVGQAAFANARKSCSPSNEERQRLIQQGRAFLKQMKSSPSYSSLSRADDAKQSFFPEDDQDLSTIQNSCSDEGKGRSPLVDAQFGETTFEV